MKAGGGLLVAMGDGSVMRSANVREAELDLEQ